MIRLTVSLIFALVAGCATEGKLQTNLNSLVGVNIDGVVGSWGYPTRQFQAPNGNTVYVYSQGGTIAVPATANSTVVGNTVMTNVQGGYGVPYGCSIFLETDSSRTIRTWRYEGNNCGAR